MQRVVSINLNGNAYQLEENGYNALFAYLDAVETSLKDSPDRADKLAELERVIAEKCQTFLGPAKTVITSTEIDRMLSELGPPPVQPAAEPSQAPPPPSASTSAPSSGSSSAHEHRRLFQIREGAMISGVCVGLSELLHFDVTIIRILFVVFALATSGWGILAYVVLMFVVPKVDTRAQASGATAAAGPSRWPWDQHGWPWDHEGWPWDKYGWPWDHPTPDQQKAREASPEWQKKQASQDTRADWREQRRAWRDERRALRVHHPLFGTILMIVFLMFGFFWLSFWTRGHFFFGWPFFWGFPHWIGIIVFFLILRLIFMPFRMARWYGYGYGPYAHPHYAWAAMWNGLAWFMAMIFVVWLMYHYIPEFHNMIHDFQTTWRDDISL
jgi:phage shock protein PspC (stress-responsive transcriptional regulator)